ncbi:MAG: MerR family DNA-binding protein [Nitrospirales bacterium]|nr:MerR family DNA-binding protein [Nitrospirales bacterium]
MKIGEIAKQAQVGIETIRFYERKGLLGQPPRTPGGYRVYPREAIAQIRFIKRAKELGFSLSEIADLLSLATNPTATCADVKHRAMDKLSAIRERMTDLQRMKRALGRLVASCNGRGPIDHCPIIECFGTLQPKEVAHEEDTSN